MEPLSPTPISIYQNNAPKRKMVVAVVDPVTDLETPVSLTGAEVEFFVKASKADADPTGTSGSAYKYSTTGGQIALTDPDNGVFTIQWNAANTATAGVFFYHLDVIKSGNRETYGLGPLTVEDI